MMALEYAGGPMLKTRLPHSRHRKSSVDLADAAVENKMLCPRSTPSTKRFIKPSRQSTEES